MFVVLRISKYLNEIPLNYLILFTTENWKYNNSLFYFIKITKRTCNILKEYKFGGIIYYGKFLSIPQTEVTTRLTQ